MGRILLLVGGLVQLLIVGVHVAMIFGIQSSDMPQAVKQTAHLFNGCVLTMVLFFAYVSLLRRTDLLTTSLGRWTCAFMSVLYLQRGVVEVIVRSLDPAYFALFIGLALLYAIAPLPPGRAAGPDRVESAIDSSAGVR